MAESIFEDKSMQPDQTILGLKLGLSKFLLERICSFIAEQYGGLHLEWKHYGKKAGWVLKIFSFKKNILFVIPGGGSFRTSFTLGDQALKELESSSVNDNIKEAFAVANKYAEGKTVQFVVSSDEECEEVLKLIQIKMK